MEKRVAISLVTWNSQAYLGTLFESLAQQTYTHCELLVRDNNSLDETRMAIGDGIAKLPFPATLFWEKENSGFAPAHNQNIREAIRRKAHYVLLVNPDCILDPHAIEVLVQAIQHHPRAGSVGGKILQAHFRFREGRTEVEKSSYIDSAGISVSRARRCLDRGQAMRDHGQFPEGAVFGNSGAFVLFRVRALIDVATPLPDGAKEYFDESFFTYKEDIDLAWRLQLLGWSSWYTPSVLVWHHRTLGEKKRRSVSARLRALSWRNHILLLLKNNDWTTDVFGAFLTILRECVKTVWLLTREWRTLSAVPSLFHLWGLMRQKRQWIMEHRRRSPQEMRETIQSFRSSS